MEQVSAKVVVIGCVGVGKSSLTMRYIHNQFHESLDSTLGAVYFQKTVNWSGRRIKLQFWDTAGQQRYKAIARIYYKDCRVALVVYDVNSRESYEGMKTWIGQLKNNAPQHIILAIIANKADIETQNHVPFEQVSMYAKDLGAIFSYTSAKDGRGIAELFNTICQKVVGMQQLQKGKGGKLKKGKAKENKKCC